MNKRRYVTRLFLLIIINISIVIIVNIYITNRKREVAKGHFLTLVERTVKYYEKYEDVQALNYYTSFVINFSSMCDMFEIYYLMYDDRSNREYLALLTIRNDLISNITQPLPYAKLLCEGLQKFDDNYIYGSILQFYEIYQIEAQLRYDMNSE